MKRLAALLVSMVMIASCDQWTPTRSVLLIPVITATPTIIRLTVTRPLVPTLLAAPSATASPLTGRAKIFTSPDGTWIAETQHRVGENDQDDQIRFLVYKADRSVKWVAMDRKAPKGLGQEFPVVHKWSNTMQYLYFGNAATPDGCALFDYTPDLYRLDLRNGNVIEILSPIAINLSLSPDERLLAYFSRNGHLVLRDLLTRLESRVSLPFENLLAWDTTWSVNSKEIVFKQALRANNLCEPESISRFRVDVATLQLTTIQN
jgi:hypothetical protein